MNSYTSIYIPRMSTHHNEKTIQDIMNKYHIGTVSYVDFTPINKKPGFGENIDSVVMSAFVHFSDPALCSDGYYHYNSRIHLGNDEFWSLISSEIPYKLQVSKNEYWICLKNKNPVKRTLMNIHQIVENGRHLENLIEEQEDKIKQLERKINGIQNVVYQLVGGLFCQNTQTDIIGIHLANLFDEKNTKNTYSGDENKWGSFPTTRQGDDCERRIEALEKAIIESNHEEDLDTEILMRKREKYGIDDSSIESEFADGHEDEETSNYDAPNYRWRHQK